MNDEDALLAAIVADPDDDVPRLAYADLMEERGQVDRARLIRVQIELARLPRSSPRYASLQEQEMPLEQICTKALPKLKGISFGIFERGFVRYVSADNSKVLRKHASRLPATVHCLSLKSLDDLGLLARSPALARFDELSIGGSGRSIDDKLAAVFESAHCPRWRKLRMPSCWIGPPVMRALAACPRMDRLTEMFLHMNQVGDEGMAALAASPYLTGLRLLNIHTNKIGNAGATALAASASLGGLVDLHFGDCVGP